MSEDREEAAELSRRKFLRLGAMAGAAVPLAGVVAEAREAAAEPFIVPGREVEEATIAGLQAQMARGSLSAAELVDLYLARIQFLDQAGPKVNSVITTNPDARRIARQLDTERRRSGPRGPLHGIPILLKDNIDTGDRMQTTAGSLALAGAPAPRDATVAARLRAAGAILLGKTNLSEWANFRGNSSTSGWSGVGGLTRNPYVLDRNPCGSSSGSGAAASASFCAAALGTETDGSIVCPASINGVVGIKPTVGLTSRAGVVPISHSQDTVGPHARTVADAAAVLSALVGVDPRDPATAGSAGHFSTNYTQFLDPDGLRGARIGVARAGGLTGYSIYTDAVFEDAIAAMRDAGAVMVDPADIPTIDDLVADPAELIVLVYEFKRDLNAYLATRTGVPVHTLADAIAFNTAHASTELKFFGQELFELAQSDPFSQQEYEDALERSHRLSRTEGLDAVFAAHQLDALVAPTGSPAWTTDLVNGDHFLGASSSPCAMAGYPIVNVTAGYAFGLPIGLSFMGLAYSEGKLIRLASGFEHVMGARRPPRFAATVKSAPAAAAPSRESALASRAQALLAALSSPRRRLHSL